MYVVENIIRNATPENKEKLCILVINDGCDDYIMSLAKNLPHDFYIVEGITGDIAQWTSPSKLENIIVCNRLQSIGKRHIDAIITFNRTTAYERAENLSNSFHIPLIVVDTASSHIKVPIPFSANLQINNDQMLPHRNGDAAVGMNGYITRSWISESSSLSLDIPYPPNQIKTENPDKILLDTKLPPDYMKQVGIIDNGIYTTDPQDAVIYLHLWQNITPLMLDCMASEIPVVTLRSPDIQPVMEKESCILIDEIKMFNNQQNLTQILKFESLPSVVNNAKEYVSGFNANDFEKKWSNVLNHICNKCFMRI